MTLFGRLVFSVATCLWAGTALGLDVKITYLERVVAKPPTLSNLDQRPDDLGASGAALAIADNSTTGRFLGHNYVLDSVLVDEGEDFIQAAREALANSPYVVVNAPAQDLLALADLAEAETALLFNTAATGNDLRSENCRANVLHTSVSRAMLADALSQFAVRKRWTDWALITGPRDGDKAFAQAIQRSAEKFGIRIIGNRDWTFDADMRRSAAQEVPLFTQDFDDHDMMIVADEINDFARYIQYNTWAPRPLGGSWGAQPTGWSGSVEQHGAVQLQNRFRELAGRDMQSTDYAALLAVRTIGEAVTRTNSANVSDLRAYILSDAFELAAFKGRPLSFRKWNGQMRQPIPIAHPGAVIALAPLEGFLHQRSELDTLGLDAPETACNAFEME